MPSKPLWSVSVREPIGGLLYAREAGRLGYYAAERLGWIDHRGQMREQVRFDLPVVLAATSETATTCVAITADQKVRFLAPDLRPLREIDLVEKPLSIAVDSLGLFCAVSDTKSNLSIFDAAGKPVEQIKTPRPVVRLGFLPSRGYLICVGDLGWIGAYNLVEKDWAWRGTLFFNAGYLAISATDTPILVGSFTDSLAAFDAMGGRHEMGFVPPPSRDVQFTFDGKSLFLLTRDGTLKSFAIDGKERSEFEPRTGVTHFKIDGFGKRVFVATVEGKIESIAPG